MIKTRCPYCHREIPFGAEVCPYCTRDLPQLTSGQKGIFVIIMGIFLLIVATAIVFVISTTETSEIIFKIVFGSLVYVAGGLAIYNGFKMRK